jgi:hypothetical protein
VTEFLSSLTEPTRMIGRFKQRYCDTSCRSRGYRDLQLTWRPHNIDVVLLVLLVDNRYIAAPHCGLLGARHTVAWLKREPTNYWTTWGRGQQIRSICAYVHM